MTLVSPQTSRPEDVFQDFFRSYQADQVGSKYRKRLAQVAVSNGISLIIDFDDLIAFDPALARSVTERPDDYITYASSAATAQMRVEDPEYAEHAGRIFARFRRLPEKRALRKIGAEDIKKLALVEGIVVRTTQVRPMILKAVFRCRKCHEIVQEEQSGDLMRGPGPTCPICKQKTAWELLEEQCKFKNTQEARVQERPEDLPPGQLPRYLDVRLEDDIVDSARPGDRVAVTSIVRAEKQYVGEKGRLRTFNLYLEANFVDVVGKETEVVEITREDEKKILEASKDPFVHRKLIMSLAPSIYGYGEIKEGILYLLFGGVSKHLPDGVSIRGDLNTLLIGDPGCLIGDERVILGDGTIAKIEDLGNHHLEELNIPVLTGGGGAEKGIATRFHVYHNQPTMEIVTETGKSIRGTYNHPLLSVEKVEQKQVRRWKRLDEFNIGDRVAVVTGFPCYITGLVDTGWRPVPYGLGPKFHGRLPTKVTPELGAFMGYILGDGWVQRYRVGFTVADGEKDILKTLCDVALDLFGIRPKVSSRKRGARNVELFEGVIHSQDVAYNLANLKEKRVPDLILKSGDRVVSPFLRWLYEADGTVFSNKRGCGSIGLKAKDIELLRDVQILLLRFGIHSRIIANTLLIRRGESILKFADKIGFASVKKQARLAHLRARAARLKRFGKQRSERVVAVYHREPADVYDIEVPESHKFIANGVVSHNTAKSQLLQYVSRIAPRGLYTSGRGTTAAGLTAAVLREKTGGMVLEAGALVLADKGIACLHPDSEVLVDGSPRNVAELFDERRIQLARSEGGEMELSPLLRAVANLDLDKLATREATATLVARRWYSGQLLRITMDSGMELRLTPTHPVLDGKTLQWKPVRDLSPGDSIVALKKLPPVHTPVRILDILPDNWIVQPDPIERMEIRRALEVRHHSMSAVNRSYELKRDALNGRSALTLGQFRAILKHIGLYESWAQRPFAFGRKKRTERLQVASFTPALCYFLGFAYGDGYVQSNATHSRLIITQSSVHTDHVRRLHEAMGQVSHGRWKVYSRRAIATGFPASSECQDLARHSSLLVYLFEWLTRNGLQNLLHLDDEALAGFFAGAVDADGRFSVKKNRHLSSVSFDLPLSNDAVSNRRLLWALRRFDVYARIRNLHGVMTVQITSRNDIQRLIERIRRYSVKAKTIPSRRTRISARHEAVPGEPLRLALSSVRPSPTELLRSGDWSTFYSYLKGKRRPYKAPLERLIGKLEPWLDSTSRERLHALAGSDYALDEIRTVQSEFYTGYVYDLRVPLGEHFVTEGVLTHNCIDELDKMRPDDRVAIHEALEQQTVCYDADTEILTEEGWRRFPDLPHGVRIATLNTAKGTLEYQEPTSFFVSSYRGEMVSIRSRQVDLLVTPNHTLYANLYKSANHWAGFGLIRANELTLSRRMRFKKNAKWLGERVDAFELPGCVKVHANKHERSEHRIDPVKLPMDLWLEFLGYYVSEGHTQVHWETGVPYRVTISQTKKEGVEAIAHCLDKLGFKYTYGGHNFWINSKQLASYLYQIGKTHYKHIPRQFKQLPPEQLRILLSALIIGDGHVANNGATTYVTSSRQLADDVTEVALKVGWSANVYTRAPDEYVTAPLAAAIAHSGGSQNVYEESRQVTQTTNIYTVSLIRKPQCEPNVNSNGQRQIERIPYSGNIYCVEVPNHIIYVRRNGKPIWCGNSVAKGGIVATLNARASVLAAANPALGRYEPHRNINENINLPVTILSRFDLIFLVKDLPEPENDTRMSEHILSLHKTRHTLEEAPFPPDFLRKYISYAKRIVPVLTPEAVKELQDFYLKMRNTTGKEAAVAITPRQLEGLVRISEARARAFLREEVTVEDAKSAVKIMSYALYDVGVDVKSGKIDIDTIMTGKPATVRDSLGRVMAIVAELERETGTVDEKVLLAAVVEREKVTDGEARRFVGQLIKEGMIYSPKEGKLKRTSG